MAQLAGCAALFAGDGSALRTLRNDHPRLLLLDSDLERLRGLIRDTAPAHKLYSELQRDADRIVSSPPVEYKLTGTQLGAQTRRVLDRVQTLALIYRLDRKQAHLDRAVKELRVAANFKDWNPARFPDTAEMSAAFAIGYDWLYPYLSPEDRTWIRDAMVQKGINPGLLAYGAQANWTTSHLSWSPICNGGMALAALAVAEDEPDRAEELLRRAIDGIGRGLSSYAPDGSWPEGPSYWAAATRYAVYFLAGLQTALGLDFGISNHPGFSKTGRFRIYGSGPSNRTFNFGDSNDELNPAPAMLWMARRYAQPPYAWQEERLTEKPGAAEPFDLVWYQRDAKPPQTPIWPLDALFTGAQCVFFRSSWEDPNALFLAVKGGDNKAPHAHLDLGTFVLDAGGVRWALDLGPDDPPAPAGGKPRWTFYRTKTEAHSTPLVDGENQDPRAEAHIVRHEFAPDLAWAQIDLSKAYPARVKQMLRRIGIAQRQAVLIEDTLQADQPVDVLWGMITDAEIRLNGQMADLVKGDWTLSAEIHSPRHAVFDMQSAQGTAKKLVVRIGEKVTDLDLNISLTPHKTGTPKPKVSAKLPT
jgi:Heparinase II/III-like protein/Domain of unknown function (DUF4962)